MTPPRFPAVKAGLQTFACLIGVFHALTQVAPAEISGDMDSIVRRGLVTQGDTGRLKAVFEKAARGEPVSVAAIGGSITAGGRQTQDPANRYIQQVAKWFEARFPNAKVSFINAGIGGTNSFYGAMRMQSDVLSRNPDLVIVEWAVNNLPGKDFAESYEGALRQILRAPGKIAVIELFFMHKDGENAQMWQEILGRHYRLPMVSFRDAMWPEFATGRVPWDDLYADVVHPKDAGHLVASKLIGALLDAAVSGHAAPLSEAEGPKPLISDVFEHCRFSAYEHLKTSSNSGWERSADNKFWESGTAGAVIEFELTGQSLFLGFDFDKENAPQAVFSVDGGEQKPLKEDAHRRPIAANLPAGVHRVRVELKRGGAPTDVVGKLKIWGAGGAGGVVSADKKH